MIFSTYQRIMHYTDSGKQEGATVHLGGERFGNEGYFINPTIFTDAKPDVKIVRERSPPCCDQVLASDVSSGMFFAST
jgi:hypothetical protein